MPRLRASSRGLWNQSPTVEFSRQSLAQRTISKLESATTVARTGALPMSEIHERPVVTEINKEAVRAGSTGHHLRYVLIASCALVIIAFIAVALFVKS
jgi:hypothetical protein